MRNIILEFSEQQQCLHYNSGNFAEDSNGYKTIFRGNIDLADKISKAIKDEREGSRVTFETAKRIAENFRNLFTANLN